jgi:hypothetical protein
MRPKTSRPRSFPHSFPHPLWKTLLLWKDCGKLCGKLPGFSTGLVENPVENVENFCGNPALCGKCGKFFPKNCGKLYHCGKLCGKCGKVFHTLCGKVCGLWKTLLSFPQILWKKLWKTLIGCGKQKSFPQLPVENSVENSNSCHAQFPQSFYGLLIVILKKNLPRMCVIGRTKVFALDTHIIKVFYKGVACGLCEFADMGKGGVGSVAMHECNAVFNFYHLRKVGNKVVFVISCGAVEQFFHFIKSSLFFLFWLGLAVAICNRFFVKSCDIGFAILFHIVKICKRCAVGIGHHARGKNVVDHVLFFHSG